MFVGKFYKQKGTAMGTKLAPGNTNILMGKLEHNILSHATLKPSFYKRYIDDILVIWPHSEADLNTFLTSMNSFHPTIKFSFQYNKNIITFLDLNIYNSLLPTYLILRPTSNQLTEKHAFMLHHIIHLGPVKE